MDHAEVTNVVLAIIGALVTSFGAWLTYLTQHIKTAVNSERTEMQIELKRLNELVTQMAMTISVLKAAAAKDRRKNVRISKIPVQEER